MPRIPTFNPDPKLPQPFVTARQEGSAIGGALREAGQQVQQTAKVIDDFRTQNQISELNAETTRANAELKLELDELIRTTDPFQAEEMVDKFLTERVATRFQEIRGIAKTKRAKRHFEGLSATVQSNLLVSGVAGANELTSLAAANAHQQSVNTSAASIFQNPDSFDTAVQLLDQTREGLVQSGALDRATAIKSQDEENVALVQARIFGLIDQGRLSEASAFVNNPQFGRDLSIKERFTLMNAIESEQKRGEVASEKRLKELEDQFQIDILERALAGEDITEEEIIANRDIFTTPADFKFATEIARGTALTDDSFTRVSLQTMSAVLPPEEFILHINRALEAQKITGTTAGSMVQSNISTFNQNDVDPLKSGLRVITIGFSGVPDSLKKAGSGIAQGKAEVAFKEWFARNPDASLEDANDKGEELFRKFTPISQSDMIFAIGRPFEYTGNLNAITNVTVTQSVTELNNARAEGRISDRQFREEMEIISSHQDILLEKQQSKQALEGVTATRR